MTPNPKQLLVEGIDDIYVIAELMGHHTDWPADKSQAPVYIDQLGGVANMLHANGIPLRLSTAAITTLGVVLDADGELQSRWRWLREHCGSWNPTMTDTPPEAGFIGENQDEGKRFGVWFMPNNASSGMLETFTQFLVPQKSEMLWNYAKEAFATAQRHKGAPCSNAHKDKAEIYTWLAWQEPPCISLGLALKSKMLDSQCAYASAFVNWFLTLYQLPRR